MRQILIIFAQDLCKHSDLFSGPVLPLFEEEGSIAIKVGGFKVSFRWSFDPDLGQKEQILLLQTNGVTPWALMMGEETV